MHRLHFGCQRSGRRLWYTQYIDRFSHLGVRLAQAQLGMFICAVPAVFFGALCVCPEWGMAGLLALIPVAAVVAHFFLYDLCVMLPACVNHLRQIRDQMSLD